MKFRFFKSNLAVMLIALLVFGGLTYGAVLPGVRAIWRAKVIGHAATDAGSILAAVTDTGAQQVITTSIQPLGVASRISATAGGTTADIAAIQVTIVGTDPNDVVITEILPAFTENNAGTVIGVKLFKKITSVTIPAHDGTLATTSIETGGSPALGNTVAVMSGVAESGDQQTVSAGSSINAIDVPRNITATVTAGTDTDIAAVQVIITGTNAEGVTITETLPAFTVNTAGTVIGSKMFKTVTSITLPAHDGTTVTTSIGTGETLGVDSRLKRNTSRNAYLAEAKEGTAPSVNVNETDIESNSFKLNSALNGTQVIFEYMETPPSN